MVFVYYFYSDNDSMHKVIGVFENKLNGLNISINYIITNCLQFLKQDVDLTVLKSIEDLESLDSFLFNNQINTSYGGSPGWYLVCEEHNIV